MTTTQIVKILTKSGFNKASYSRVNFETISHGDFEANKLQKFGLNCIVITPKNGKKPEDFIAILKQFNPEVKNGYLIVKNI